MEISKININPVDIKTIKEFNAIKLDYQNKITHLSKNSNTINNSFLTNAYSAIQDINRDFITKLHELDSLYLEAIDRTVHITRRSTPSLTEKEINDISKEHSKLRKKFDEKIEKWNVVEKKLLNSSDEKILYGWMAKAAYMNQVKKDKILHTGAGDYRTVSVIKNVEGLRAVSFIPVNKDGTLDENRRPILSFRGTNPSNMKHLNDDLQHSIGDLSFSHSKNEIEEQLNFLKDLCNNKGCVTVGHSLGGALAQRATAEFAGEGLVAEAFYYNSPGVGDDIVNQYNDNTAGKNKPKIVDIHHHADIIQRFGGARLPTENSLVIDTPSKISKLAAHKLNNLLDNLENVGKLNKLNDYKGRFDSLRNRAKHFILETGRAITSPLLRGILKLGAVIKETMPNIKSFFGDLRGQQIEMIKLRMKLKKEEI
ncbi:MAG: hypothetical protein H0V82_10805 [Candidatus Protochlamydia sp.]|nr:hypothetical protein [Candidatus Protochlamydia sp.]